MDKKHINVLCCFAGEIGKIVVNNCIDKNIPIDLLKLEKLLVLINIEYIKLYKKPLFIQDMLVTKTGGVRIPDICQDFNRLNFYLKVPNQKLIPYITLLDEQRNVINSILQKYGNLTSFELEETREIKKIHDNFSDLYEYYINGSLINFLDLNALKDGIIVYSPNKLNRIKETMLKLDNTNTTVKSLKKY